MASIKFDITGNANGFIAATRQAEAASKGMMSSIAEQGKHLDDTFKKIATSAGALFTVQMASQFSSKVAQVRGEFQQLEVAFETMLQSKEKADALMAQVVDTAARTPFDLQGVANGAKQLLAYGIASDEVNDTLIRLGDIAAGLSIPLNDLVYLYGTTMTQGRLFTQDLRQFQGRGIPIADELAKQFGVTKDAVGELVTAGKVGFPEVEKAIKAMTDEGGKFNNLMAKQSKTITGQISNLEDAIDQMLNNIGQASEGAISRTIGAASALVENYQKVGEVVSGLVITYGAYKAVVMTASAINTAVAKAEKATLVELLAVKGADAAADEATVSSTGRASAAIMSEVAALKLELDERMKNLTATMLAAKGEQAAALTKVENLRIQIALAKMNIAQRKEELALAAASGNVAAIGTAQMNLETAAKERNTLSRQLNVATKELEIATTNAETATSARNALANDIETASIQNQTKATTLLTAAKKKLAAVGAGLKAALTNPYVLAGVAVAGLVALTWKLCKALDAEENAHKNVAKALDEQSQKLEQNKQKAEDLMRTISDEASTEMQRVQALEELRALYPRLFKDMSDQEIKSLSQAEATKKLAEETEKLREEELKRLIQQKTASLTATKEVPIMDPETNLQIGTKTVGMSANYIKQTKLEIEELQAELDKLTKLREQAEFNQKPKEVQIVTLQGQIDKLKEENAELDKQIKTALAKKWTLNELGNLNFDWLQSGNADAMLAQQAANAKVIADLEKKLDEIRKTPPKKTTTSDKGKKEHKAIKELKTYEAAVNAKRKIQDVEHQANIAHLKTIENDRERETKLREAENRREIEEINRQKEDYINALTKAKVEELVAKKQKNIDVAAIRKEISESATVKRFDDIVADTTKQQEQQTAELVKSELLAYQEMLSEYGNYYSQKLAIATMYEDKIKKAATEEEKASLRTQMANDQSNIEAKALEQNINFQGIFSGLGGMFKDVVEPALKEAKAYMATEEFKSADLESKQSFIQTVNELEQAIGGTESNFAELGTQVNEYKKAQESLAQEEQSYKASYDELVVAQDEYAKALASGNQTEIDAAAIKLASAKKSEQTSRENLEKQQATVATWQKTMTTSAVTIKSAMNGIVSGLQKLGSGSLSGVYQGLIEFGKSADQLKGKLGDALGKFAEKLEKVPILGLILSIIDLLKDGIGNFIAGLLDTITGAIAGILKEIFSGKIFVTIGKAIAEGIYNIIDGLFGGFLTSWLDKAITTKQEKIESKQKDNEDIDKTISKLDRALNKLYSKDAAENLRSQNDELQKQKDNYAEMIEIEKSKKNPDEEQIAEWEAAMDDIDNQIEDNADKVKEAINGITFDAFRDKFLDALLDMENGVEGLSESVEEDIRRAMYEALLTNDEFENEMQGLYADLADAIESDNYSEIARIQKQIEDLYAKMAAEGKEIDEKLGYEGKSDREASEKGIAQASQTSIDELNGTMTNIQSHTFSINQQMASVVNITSQILARVTSIDANTSRLSEIEDTMKYMREDISSMATKGIVMR